MNYRIIERIDGNTSDFWSFEYILDQVAGGAYALDVGYDCVVNKTGQPDEYCTDIVYPDGNVESVDTTVAYTRTVHGLGPVDATVGRMTGFFGRHSTPPPTGSAQVVKFVQLTGFFDFPDRDITVTSRVRGFDVCVPNQPTFAGVQICPTSGTGS